MSEIPTKLVSTAVAEPRTEAAHEREAALATLLRESVDELHLLREMTALVSESAGRGLVPSNQITELHERADRLARDAADLVAWVDGPRREVRFDAIRAVGGAARRVERDLPPGVRVRFTAGESSRLEAVGPASFLARVLSGLVRSAAQRARSEVQVLARASAQAPTAEVEIRIEHDGGPPRPGDSGPTLEPWRWLVAQLGGVLELDRAGTAVVWLRVHPAAAGSAPAADGPLAGHLVLLVDDEPAVRTGLARYLRRRGAEVVENDGTGVSALLEGLDTLPSGVLIDARLGHASGEHLLRDLEARFPALAGRGILMSGEYFALDRSGGTPRLPKPVDFALLERLLAEVRGARDS